MKKINKEEFEKIVALGMRAACEYHKVGRIDTCGLFFENIFENGNFVTGRVRIISPYFLIEVTNIEFEDGLIPATENFFNIISGKWTKSPYVQDLDELVRKKHETYKFVGSTKYNASNIINIIGKEEEKVMEAKARYVFVNGILPENAMIVSFSEKNGKPYYGIPGYPKEFKIIENSDIPEEGIVIGQSYAAFVSDEGDYLGLNVVCKFGKTRSGMFVSDVLYNSECLPLLNELKIIHPELTTCSNELDIQENTTMPPMHFGAMILGDVLKTFLINDKTSFNLHFQEEVNKDARFESINGQDEAHIEAFLAPLDYYKNIQRG